MDAPHLLRELTYKNLRPAYGAPDKLVLRDPVSVEIQLAFTQNGKTLFSGSVVNASGVPPRVRAWPGQVSSDRILELLKFDGPRPIWTSAVFEELLSLKAQGKTLSPRGYPGGAEDVYRACRHYLPQLVQQLRENGGRRAAERSDQAHQRPTGRRPHLRIGIWSSITPWLETVLLTMPAIRNMTRLTVVDYNEPIMPAPRLFGDRLTTLNQNLLAKRYAEGLRFDAIVSFSGIEHDGLGRYGDPINPDGDIAALREMNAFLKPHGLLFLGIPVGAVDDIEYPFHRIYGPKRLPLLLRAGLSHSQAPFKLLGRVWNGFHVGGGLETSGTNPILWRPADFPADGRGVEIRYGRLKAKFQHQPVLVLRRTGDAFRR